MPSRIRRTPFPRYVWGPKPKRRTEFGLLLYGSGLVIALYVIAELGAKSKIPADFGPFLGVVLGLALVAHMANRWLVPDANAVILPLAALLNGIGYVVIARWNPPHAREQAAWAALGVVLYVVTLLVVQLLAGPRALPLPVAPPGRHPPGGTAVLQPHQRRPALGPLRRPGVPADRILEAPPVHLLRLLLRGEQGDAVHPDGPPGEPAHPRPAPADPPPRGLGRRHGGDRPRGRHRLRGPPVHPLHRHAVDHDRPLRLPAPRRGALRRRGVHLGALLRPGAHPGRRMAEPVGDDDQHQRRGVPNSGWASSGSAPAASAAPGSGSTSRRATSRTSRPT